MNNAVSTGSYVRWKKNVADHDYAAATSYLSIRFGEKRAERLAGELRKLPVITRRANDVMRAVGRVPLPLSDPGVLKDLQKILSGQKLSPILLAEGDIADGYHRLSLAYALDPYTDVPLKLGPVSEPDLHPDRGQRHTSVSTSGIMSHRPHLPGCSVFPPATQAPRTVNA